MSGSSPRHPVSFARETRQRVLRVVCSANLPAESLCQQCRRSRRELLAKCLAPGLQNVGKTDAKERLHAQHLLVPAVVAIVQRCRDRLQTRGVGSSAATAAGHQAVASGRPDRRDRLTTPLPDPRRCAPCRLCASHESSLPNARRCPQSRIRRDQAARVASMSSETKSSNSWRRSPIPRCRPDDR